MSPDPSKRDQLSDLSAARAIAAFGDFTMPTGRTEARNVVDRLPVIARCLTKFTCGRELRICNMNADHDEPHVGYPARSSHGILLAELRDARGAVEALRSLRAAWDRHMATCPQHANVPSLEEIDAWMKAPSNTASGGQSKTPAASDEIRRREVGTCSRCDDGRRSCVCGASRGEDVRP